MATNSNSTEISCGTTNAGASGVHALALDVQNYLQRIIEMARLIERESNDLSVDSEPNRFRICSEVIWEAAEAAMADAEKIETTIARAAQTEA